MSVSDSIFPERTGLWFWARGVHWPDLAIAEHCIMRREPVLREECNKTYNHPGQVHKIDQGDTTSTLSRAAASCSAKFLTLLSPPQSGQSKKFPGTTRLLSFVQFSEVHWILLNVNQVDRHRRVKMFHDTNKLYFEIHFCKIVGWDNKKHPNEGTKRDHLLTFLYQTFSLIVSKLTSLIIFCRMRDL